MPNPLQLADYQILKQNRFIAFTKNFVPFYRLT